VSLPGESYAPLLSVPSGLPPAVSQLATTHQLGPHLSTFPPHKRWRFIIAIGVLAAISVLAGVLLAVNLTEDPLYALALAVAAVLIIVPVGFFVWSLTTSPVFSAKAREWQIYVFEQGYVRVSRKGVAAYRWDLAQSVYQEIVETRVNGISSGTQYRYRITFSDGRVEKLTTYVTDMRTFGPLVQYEIAKVQVPQAWQMLHSGQSIPFGDFGLSSGGVTVRGSGGLPWSEIREIQVIQGNVRIMRHGKRLAFATVQAKRIPNLHTFLALMEGHLGKR
jgi:hypothetical protein